MNEDREREERNRKAQEYEANERRRIQYEKDLADAAERRRQEEQQRNK